MDENEVWRSMADAPKDGTHVLVAYSTGSEPDMWDMDVAWEEDGEWHADMHWIVDPLAWQPVPRFSKDMAR